MGRGWRATLAATVATVALAACAPGDSGTDPAATDPATPGASAGEATEVPTAPGGLLECGDPDADKVIEIADADLTTATWSTPSGFEETFAYHEENPVEEVFSSWTAQPTADVALLNVVTVVIYDGLDWGEMVDQCGAIPVERIMEIQAGYTAEIGAETLTEPEVTTVAGHPAVEQYISLPEYDYHGYWLFSRTQVLHAYCQWTNEEDLLEAACAELIPSIQVSP
ncbi:hypothetical protein EXU48_18185 [Occultella glacieicola]|uniref:Uncharacterized protein n=1 Tax=Occultella glacieicola TaxID=2518684 RepID=A0ABY2DZS0_9MICO|nr:hypothetical protein [Occultella glacieicola]TDE90383.1 hypothetical protein EXU48_18185 [Occultella glacieicola]